MFLIAVTIISIGWLLVGIDTWIAARKDRRIAEGNEIINQILNQNYDKEIL
jgi:uncharacterized membrane protein YsdA (DUF1294 family)